MKMKNPHILVLPYPAQGHVIPLMKLSHELVKHGCKITFVNTDINHSRILNALAEKEALDAEIQLVSIPDGMEPCEDRNDLGKLTEAMCQVMPRKLEELVHSINKSGSNDITCLIADENMGWALQVAENIGMRRAAFWPASASLLTSTIRFQKLVDDGIIDKLGTPIIKNQTVQFSPTMPPMNTANLVWACMGDMTTQKIIVDLIRNNNKALEAAEWFIGNSIYDLEPSAFDLAPKFLPIGPLLSSTHLGGLAGQFWQEDFTCLNWLDQQPPNSVIYIAFGSFTVLDHAQLEELALGLEQTKRSFLWVVRPDMSEEKKCTYPKGFEDRVGTMGKMVAWAPQQQVLSHPSIACFVSHCGWNSTMDGIVNAVPFLCWPYFADQFLNESYICDIWKVGMKLKRDKGGIITREDIRNKIEQVLGDKGFKERALDIKELAMNNVKEGGRSYNNFQSFVDWIKGHSS